MNKHPSPEQLHDATPQPADQAAPKRRAKAKPAKRTCIMVLGMHRSGTSALTRAISLLGAELPKNLLGANPSNPTGHWEPQRLIELHDQMLAEAGSRWDDWRSFDLNDLGTARLQFYKAEIAKVIDEEYGSASLFVLKEPRISRFVPLYAEILERMHIDVRYTLVSRNPLAVIASLKNRDGFTAGFSSLLWLRHELDAEHATRGQSRIFLSYEGLLDDWRQGIEGITNTLGIDWPRPKMEWQSLLATHFSADNRHFTASADLLDADPRIAGWIKDAYAALTALEKNARDERALKQIDAVSLAFEGASSIFGDACFPELDARIRAMSEVQAETARVAESRSVELKELEVTVAKMRAEAAERDERAAKFASDLAKTKRKFQADMDRRAAEAGIQETTIATLRAQLNEKDAAVEEEKNRFLHALETLSAIKSSRSWKITRPLRAATTVARSFPPFRLARTLVRSAFRGVSVGKYAAKRVIYRTGHALKLIRSEGFYVTFERAKRFAVRKRHALPGLVLNSRTDSSSFSLVRDDGATNARRLSPEHDVAVRIPLPRVSKVALPGDIAVIVHVFYTEVFPEILAALRNVGKDFSLYVSTVDNSKAAAVRRMCEENGFERIDIRIFENRGRDIAPKIVGFRDIYDRHEFFLHLHTKKSPHLSALEGWRSYLIDNLIGSKEIVKSVFSIFMSNPKIGIIYPQHYAPIQPMLNWGFDFNMAKGLLRRANWDLSKDSVLEFPSGSMFWGRSAALKPLLDLELSFDDFPDEVGQVDGTLAHAIERSYLHFAECAGFSWLKIQKSTEPPSPTLLALEQPSDARLMEQAYAPLFEEPGRLELSLSRDYGELRPLKMTRSNSRKPRINLLLPTIDPLWIFGGISTAIKVFDEIAAELPDFDKRIVVLDSPVERSHLQNFPGYVLNPHTGHAVVFEAFNRTHGLDVREDDVYISTAWWSEYLRRSIARFQEKAFGRSSSAVYFIQDYESNFVQWSSRWAIAESTYDLGQGVIPLVNSEELSTFLKDRFDIAGQHVVPYQVNRTIERAIERVPKERIILCYGRPTAARNCFEIIVDGLSLWQQRDPVNAIKWQVVFLGENFDPTKTWPVQNCTVPGKVSLEEYAGYLSRASVGISLMISPHPSYPPLEMAHAGLITISNNYDSKNISERSENLIGIDRVTPDEVAAALEESIKLAEENIGRLVNRKEIRNIPFVGTRYDPGALAARLHSTT
ncbi:rhamnan synthesis F family protein [Mesorhizobium sp. WSM4904]|uniref:rhamnosyltransferase WsaF family glycosyltransferase n=1 Tax=Mesorhizobium sp. WSM4904 TaxID=3038545 RepID=UPI00241871FD|nr:rhamnan synthesis F family protein [Mesorhizobium sp. WSM4904]WFP62236.1 rhamnan synthesis F family protein [Mesorhizobium sp. WSM4904]